MGKSRLKYEAVAIARAMGMEVHEARALPFGGGPFGAVADLLTQALSLAGLSPSALPQGVREGARKLGLGAVDRRHVSAILGLPDRRKLDRLRPQDVRLNSFIAVEA